MVFYLCPACRERLLKKVGERILKKVATYLSKIEDGPETEEEK